MALPKAVQFAVIILVVCYSLEKQGCRQSLTAFFEELMGAETSSHHIVKRAAATNATDYELQIVVNISDLEGLQMILNTLSFPIVINTTGELTSVNLTTVCSSNMSRYQCRCEENFAWSYNSCISNGACDAISGNTCGCINDLPADNQYCQPNSSQTVISTTPAATTNTTQHPATAAVISTTPAAPTNTTQRPTTAADPVETDLILDLHIPVISVPSNFFQMFRNTLASVQFPVPVTSSLTVIDVNFTTGCYPNSSTGGLQCQCEAEFLWSCDMCLTYGECSNASRQTCECINGLPPGLQFCQPITSVPPCPTPTTTITRTPDSTIIANTTTPEITVTPTTLITTTTTTTATTPTTTTTTTTTTPTTTTTTTPTTTTTTTTTATVISRSAQFTMEMTYEDSYNNPTNDVYKNVYKSITTTCKNSVSGCSVNTLSFKSGSTIAVYNVSAPSLSEPDMTQVKNGVFKDLASQYPVVFDNGPNLVFEPKTIFIGNSVTVTCGPPPSEIVFGSNWEAVWTVNGAKITEDAQHKFTKTLDGASKLVVTTFFRTDDGNYECKLKQTNGSIFRQTGFFTAKPQPLIQVAPVSEIVTCDVKSKKLSCSASDNNTVEFKGFNTAGASITLDFPTPSICPSTPPPVTCQTQTSPVFTRNIILQFVSSQEILCRNATFGDGTLGFVAVVACTGNKVGEITAVCQENGKYGDVQDNCILQVVKELLDQSEILTAQTLPVFLAQLSTVTVNNSNEITGSPATIKAIVNILTNVANTSSSLSILINRNVMTDVLKTADVLTSNDATESWSTLNKNDTKNITSSRSNNPESKSSSSSFLQSLETITSRLTNDSFNISTPLILLDKTTFTDTFSHDFNSSVAVDIPGSDGRNKSITVITFASMNNVLPPRDKVNSSVNVINGKVALIQSSGTINNISITFDTQNDTLGNPQCVFWNFSLYDGLGGWDTEGCTLVFNVNETVSCNCNHLTSFSILMSPNSPDDPALDYITYIGVGISMGSLVICLIIEGVIWKKIRRNATSYLRHVSIVNIAVSLLIADIWFIIGAAISKKNNTSACSAAVFFIHFFYLALFFWMLASALLLLYRTISVFDGGLSKMSMLAIGFSLGYGAPLIIAVITVAVTAPKNTYIRENVICWLNWYESKALLAFVIPALLIVVINLIILFVVIYKIVRRRVSTTASQADEKHVLLVIVRSLAVLTPFFGLTWGLGVGIMVNPSDRGIHIAFAFFNSLQGFFILVFGTLLDKKVRSELAAMSQSSQSGTRSTSGGVSFSKLGFLQLWRRGKGSSGGYNVSSNSPSNSFNT